MDSSMTCKTLSAAWRSGEIKDEIEISPLLQIQKTFFLLFMARYRQGLLKRKWPIQYFCSKGQVFREGWSGFKKNKHVRNQLFCQLFALSKKLCYSFPKERMRYPKSKYFCEKIPSSHFSEICRIVTCRMIEEECHIGSSPRLTTSKRKNFKLSLRQKELTYGQIEELF